MSERKDGGPAFPQWDRNAAQDVGGLSVRDYFAAHAPKVPGTFMREVAVRDGEETLEDDVEWQVRWAFAYADAMLAAREK